MQALAQGPATGGQLLARECGEGGAGSSTAGCCAGFGCGAVLWARPEKGKPTSKRYTIPITNVVFAASVIVRLIEVSSQVICKTSWSIVSPELLLIYSSRAIRSVAARIPLASGLNDLGNFAETLAVCLIQGPSISSVPFLIWYQCE
jgi:hypothetical protein